MAQVNMNSILNKVKEFIKTPEFQKNMERTMDMIVMHGAAPSGQKLTLGGAEDAASAFINVLREEIESSASAHMISNDVTEALIKLTYDAPRKVGKNKYEISISFSEGLQRPSLDYGTFGGYSDEGIQNIAALLNRGYEARDYAYGVWEGHGDERIRSQKKRTGAYFIDNAVRRYMAEYANKYGVIDIEVADIYK